MMVADDDDDGSRGEADAALREDMRSLLNQADASTFDWTAAARELFQAAATLGRPARLAFWLYGFARAHTLASGFYKINTVCDCPGLAFMYGSAMVWAIGDADEDTVNKCDDLGNVTPARLAVGGGGVGFLHTIGVSIDPRDVHDDVEEAVQLLQCGGSEPHHRALVVYVLFDTLRRVAVVRRHQNL